MITARGFRGFQRSGAKRGAVLELERPGNALSHGHKYFRLIAACAPLKTVVFDRFDAEHISNASTRSGHLFDPRQGHLVLTAANDCGAWHTDAQGSLRIRVLPRDDHHRSKLGTQAQINPPNLTRLWPDHKRTRWFWL